MEMKKKLPASSSQSKSFKINYNQTLNTHSNDLYILVVKGLLCVDETDGVCEGSKPVPRRVRRAAGFTLIKWTLVGFLKAFQRPCNGL